MTIRQQRNAVLAARVIKGLESRNMEGYFVETAEDALAKALELMPEGSSVSWGGSMSVEDCGLIEAVRAGNYEVIDRSLASSPEEKRALQLQAFGADFFLGSANAMSEDGVMVNIDKFGNRIGAFAYGPSHVLLIVGMNKVVKTVEDAVSRARNEAAAINAQRFAKDAPCIKNGTCYNCKSADTICSNIMITRYNPVDGRVKVILVDEALGF
ncbi:MAG: lactate utilization protein [Hespellia sp.]|nr:lactate utilization protein [Hespellia sp.]